MFSSLPCFCTFTCPSLLVVDSHRNFFIPTFCFVLVFFFAAWQQTRYSVPAHVYSLSFSRSGVVLLINFNISLDVFIDPL